MADAAAARREARRRKILENSGNRLQLIAGKSELSPRVSPSSSLKSVRPILEPEYDILDFNTSSTSFSTPLPNGALHPESEVQFSPTPSYEIHASGSGDGEPTTTLPQIGSTGSTDSTSKPAVPVWEKLTNHKYDLVILSLLIQLLNGLSLITFGTDGYFFLPVIIYTVTKTVWFPQQNTSNITNLLLLLNGMTPSRMRKVLFFSQIFSFVTYDIFVYLFTTICIQSLWITLCNIVT